MAGDKSGHIENSEHSFHGRNDNLGETPTTEDVQDTPKKPSPIGGNNSQPAATPKPSKSPEDHSKGELSESEDDDSALSCEEIEREYDAPSETKGPGAEALVDEEFKHEDRYYGEESVRVSPYKYQPESVSSESLLSSATTC
ncbi:hypothetical protein CMUS01_12060 [Colletotrichum musicola]|uniref:Uncharacterized protein n=1 Tax=Colletotrichum musicola TaxID=2175873 RepID=A0A8H6JS16_9PEZI|nr:hypothetical protein CMUS01_12060 [Colletotrichum musicola]